MKKEGESFFTQPEIDLMYWQYCMGIHDVINSKAASAHNVDRVHYLGLANLLSGSRSAHIKELYHRFPSFKVLFEDRQSHFGIIKTAL